MEAASRDRAWLALLLGGWLALVGRFWFVCDDAYISFRYARHWAEGVGLRYNLDGAAPVEGYSNFLWVALGAVLTRAGAALEVALPCCSVLSGALLLVLVYRTARRRLDASPPVAFLAAAAIGWCAPFAVWSTSGLETLAFALLLFACFDALVLAPGGPRVVPSSVLALALALIRVEGGLWVLFLLALAFAVRRGAPGTSTRRLLGVLALVAVGFVVYSLWRHAHFGDGQASTVRAKVGFSLARLERGLAYVAVQSASTLTFALVVPGALVAWSARRRPGALPAALTALAVFGFAALVSGDFMAFGRFLVPALPFLGLLVALLLQRAGRAAPLVGVGALALGLLPAWDVVLVPRSVLERIHFRSNQSTYRSELEYWREQRENALRWATRGDALAAIAGPGDSVVLGGIGATGYRSRLFVHDRYGLVSAEVSGRERPERRDLGTPGHDQPVDRTWFVGRGADPTFLLAKLRRGSSAEALLTQMEASVGLMDPALRERYVFEFVGVPSRDAARIAGEPDGVGAECLFLWRRLRPGESSADAWSESRAARTRLRRTGRMPMLDVPPVDTGSALPGWWSAASS